MSQPKPDYRFYATLLDSYLYFLSSEQENAFQEFIDKLNRVPYSSDAANKGKAFNALVDLGNIVEGNVVEHDNFTFKANIVNRFIENLEGHKAQYFTKANLQTSRGIVELYGYTDKIYADTVTDIKTTGSYSFPKYLHNLQHIVYPYCLSQEGNNIPRFKYMVTDFSNYYEEDYFYNPARDIPALVSVCESLIDFIETNRNLITDLKLFALDTPKYAE